MKAWQVAGLVLLVSIGLARFGPDPFATRKGAEQAVSALTPRRYIIEGDEVFGCRTRPTMERFLRLRSDGDKAAFGRILMESYRSGECRDLLRNQIVYLSDTAVLSGLVKVRPEGGIDELWLLSGAVVRR